MRKRKRRSVWSIFLILTVVLTVVFPAFAAGAAVSSQAESGAYQAENEILVTGTGDAAQALPEEETGQGSRSESTYDGGAEPGENPGEEAVDEEKPVSGEKSVSGEEEPASGGEAMPGEESRGREEALETPENTQTAGEQDRPAEEKLTESEEGKTYAHNEQEDSVEIPESDDDTQPEIQSDEVSEPEELEGDTADEETAESLMTDDEVLIPSERVEQEDLEGILGSGIDRQVDPELDAVEELIQTEEADEGIYQMAAEASGKTDDAALDAAEAAADEDTVIPEEVELALENAGLSGSPDNSEELDEKGNSPDRGTLERQNGKSAVWEPADTREAAMAYLSSFVLSEVKDGAGDWDDARGYEAEGDGYDWQGNDSDSHNAVVRTFDQVTYTFSYSTALNTEYIYNTISGTRLYLEYSLPMKSSEVVFDTGAMPWLRGDGPDKKPVIYYTLPDGKTVTSLENGQTAVSQRLVGYRELPDRRDSEGGAYDVPGAGTINCILSVREAANKSVIKPEFKAWLEAAGQNEHAPEENSGIVRTAENPKGFADVRVTSGPYVSIHFLKKNSYPWTMSHYNTFTWRDGSFSEKAGKGRIKALYFEIIAGKPGGTIKGTSPIDNTKPITVNMRIQASASDTAGATAAGLYDLRTGGMGYGDYLINDSQEADDRIRFFWHENGEAMAEEALGQGQSIGAGPSRDRWSGEIKSDGVHASDGLYSFQIQNFERSGAGETLSTGELYFFQQMKEYGDANMHYYLEVTVPSIEAVSKLGGGNRSFPQTYLDSSGAKQVTSETIENHLDGSGTWDSHLNIHTYASGDNWNKDPHYRAESSNYSTSATVPYGRPIVLYQTITVKPASTSEQERSRLSINLWDNRYVTVDHEKDGPDPNPGVSWMGRQFGENGRKLYIVKNDGSTWSSANEMKSVSLLTYRDLLYFDSYQHAVSFLASKNQSTENIVGMAVEWFGEPLDLFQQVHFEYALQLKTRSDVPAEDVIGKVVETTQNVIGFRDKTISAQRSIGGADGTGTKLTAAEVKNARMIWPSRRVYDENWDALGDVSGTSTGARQYTPTSWDTDGHIIASSLSAHNTVHEGQSIYITGYQLKVSAAIVKEEIGGMAEPAVTCDLSEKESVIYEVTPSFQRVFGVTNVSGDLLLPAPRGQDGAKKYTSFKKLYAKKLDGEVVELPTDGSKQQISDFVDGGTGTFSVSYDEQNNDILNSYMSADDFRNDQYDGKIFLISPKQKPAQALSGDNIPSLTAKNETSQAQQYQFVKSTNGGYGIRNVATGKYLCVRKTGAAQNIVPGNTVIAELADWTTTWHILENADGSVCFLSGYDPHYAINLRGSGTTAWMTTYSSGENQTNLDERWYLTQVSGGTGGVSVHFEGLNDEAGIPVFYPEYTLNKAQISTDTEITQTVFVAGDMTAGIGSAADQHSASTGLDFVEIYANVLKELVDTKTVKVSELKSGKELIYTIRYTNQYKADHLLSLTDSIAFSGDEDGTDIRKTTSLKVTAVSAAADAGSAITVSTAAQANESRKITADGTLKSGETAEITYHVMVENPTGDTYIRNSCVQEDTFGTVRSNRVETWIRGMTMQARIYKKVSKVSNSIGEAHTWTLTSTIPEDLYVDQDVVYQITDQIDPGNKRLDFAGNVKVRLNKASVDPDTFEVLDGNEEESILLTAETDYLLEAPGDGSTGGTLCVKMTPEGLKKLEEHTNDGYMVQVLYDTAINETAEAAVHIPNDCTLDYGVEGELLPQEKNPVTPYVYTGDIPILKRDAGTKRPLKGVTFQIFLDENGMKPFMKNEKPCSMITGEDGRVLFHGEEDGTYYLKEIKTVSGHDLLAGTFQVTVKDGLVGDGSDIIVDNSVSIPLHAGGSGKTAFVSAALLMLAVALSCAGWLRRYRKSGHIRNFRQSE